MKDLEELLNNTDFSQDSRNKEAIKERLLGKYTKGEISMKRFKFKPRYAVAAAAVFAVGISIAACGEEIVRIAQQFTVGKHATFVAGDDTAGARSTVQVDIFTDEEIATARSTGQTLTREMDDGSIIAVRFNDDVFSYEKEIDREKNTVTYFDTVDNVKPYLAFNPLIPVSMPDGFTLDRICLFNDENGSPLPLGSNMYLEVYYTNADKTQQIYMQVRMMNEESGFTASAGPDMRYITINGNKGVVDGNNVHIEIDGVMYMFLAGRANGVTQNDVIKMAESLR
jgi:hypothetical protein